ncbi:MAG: hypothetical protein MPJ50_16960, partial [Pirellulales bacterium]|nr:hypothetical protein [Pirellulales bacterium]
MARSPRPEQTESFGSDSFLDIVSNIVGILIILVMVVGVRVRFASDQEEVTLPEVPAAPEIDLVSARAAVADLESEIQQMGFTLSDSEVDLRQEILRMNLLADEIRSTSREIDQERLFAAARTRTVVELAEDLDAKQKHYEALLFETQKQSEVKPRSVRIDSFQTPMSRKVTGEEVHFQLKGKLIAHVPINELVEMVSGDFRGKLQQMRTTLELSSVVGPVEGFRCRY